MTASVPGWLPEAHRHSPWEELRVVVAGLGVAGFAAADALQHLGATVTVIDDNAEGSDQALLLEILGVDLRLGPGSGGVLPDDTQLLVTSPGWPPHLPVFELATARGVPVWGDVELAWRLRDPEHPGTWLCVTGTNGKTTTVQMLHAILQTAGIKSVACGNVGLPIVEAVMDPEPYAVYAVELSSFQLHYTHTMAAESAAVLNVAEDHLDWYESLHDYAADKGRIYEQVQRACVYNVADPETERLVREADVVEGAGGRFLKSRGEGDATMSVFVRASDAAVAAVALQRAVDAEPWPGGLALRIRIALHSGEAQLRDGDYFGTTVNRAARLRGLATGGQVLCSTATAALRPTIDHR